MSSNKANHAIVEDRIYSPCTGFATACEIDNMDFIRQFLDWAYREFPEKAKREPDYQLQMFGS